MKTPIPPDWKPSARGEQEARRRGCDLAVTAEEFRSYYLAHGTLMADWDAAFLNWLRRVAAFAPKPAAAERMSRKEREEADWMARAASLGLVGRGLGAASGDGSGPIVDQVAERTDAPNGVGRTRAPP